ncbi:MAG: hypothetical protein KDA61_10675 [Planctomycetales bacterium]|nr:hypothetical protein [Planctomycetales bacterium]
MHSTITLDAFRESALGLGLQVFEAFSKATKKRLEEFNQRSTDLVRDLDEVLTEGRQMAEDRNLAVLELGFVGRAEILDRLRTIVVDRIALAELCRDELKPHISRTEKEAEELVESVKVELEQIGSGLEAEPAFATNIQAAQVQFDKRARCNTRARKALETARNVNVRHSVCEDNVRESRRRLEEVDRLADRLCKAALIANY